MKHVALLTSTIAPNQDVYALQIKDPTERLNQYKKAFSKYLKDLEEGTFDHIVYVDNSGYSLDELVKLARESELFNRVEFISYTSEIDVNNKSRFFLELNLINYCIANSSIIKSNPDCMIWKITGRYLISNVKDIVSLSKNKKFELCINFRNYPYKASPYTQA